MGAERQVTTIPVEAIRIDLQEPSVTLEGAEGPFAKLVFSSGSIFFQKALESPPEALISPDAETAATPSPVESGVEARPEKERPVVLSGKIKSRPRQGRPDSQGHPTAWARLAVHEEGQEDAHIYSATFHRASAQMALRLAMDDAVTVEGYPHPSDDPEGKRLDTLSVFRFLNYPGKPERPAG